MYRIRKGLNLPITGTPAQQHIEVVESPTSAIIGFDYHGLKPQMEVAVGDKVQIGQPLFRCKTNIDVPFVAPVAGVVEAVNRGLKRSLQSVIVRAEGKQGQVSIPLPSASKKADQLAIRQALLQSGLWTAFRTRPFSQTPAPDIAPKALFITAIDSNPLAVDPDVVIAKREEDFVRGVQTIAAAFDCTSYLCIKQGSSIPRVDAPGIQYAEFDGKHPFGNVGTHMHLLSPAGRHATNVHIGYQDVIAVGRLFADGSIDATRVVSLAGPMVKNPGLLQITRGADLITLTHGRLNDGDVRLLSGSVFSGRKAEGAFGWLGNYHTQISAIAEGKERHLLRYLSLGANSFSTLPIYLSSLMQKTFAFNSSTNGSERAMVPIGMYERVMPLDIMATQLLRSLIVGDIEMAEHLGCLELDEEDLALCTFVCSGKYEYAPLLRETLARIQKEG